MMMMQSCGANFVNEDGEAYIVGNEVAEKCINLYVDLVIDEIKLFILDEVLDADRRVDGPAWKNARGPAQVVYACPQIVIVTKPAGLAVDGPEDDTLLNRTLLYLNPVSYTHLDGYKRQ